MTFELTKFENPELKSKDGLHRIISEPHSNKHARLKVGQNQALISWNGIDEMPTILFLEKFNLLLIGVSESVAVLNKTGLVEFKVGLSNPFNFFLQNDLGFLIVTETTIVVVNGINCSVGRLISIPDIIQDVQLKDDQIYITGLDGSYVM